jgi:hypothetical protein
VHRRKGAIEQKQQEPIEQEKIPDLNKIIMDLHTISKASSNLALALSVYANCKGELDPKKFKLVKQPESEEQEKSTGG